VFFDTWAGLGRVLIAGLLAYFALIVILRISGKRTLSKFNAFDLVVTVALGSTLATVLLSKDVALAEGVLALGLLASLQYAIAWLSVRSERFQSLVKSEPTLLVYDGRFLERAMRQQRVSREEIMAALRQSDLSSPAKAHGVVLETDGSISVTRVRANADDGPAAVLQTIAAAQLTGNTAPAVTPPQENSDA
jgi:uncharacterized membrane protein YcaP (DUF421 family)